MSRVMRMTLGDNADELLVRMAIESIIFSYEPEKAIEILTGSLIGCTEDMALKIISGEFVIEVSEDKTSFYVSKYNPSIHKDKKIFDFNKWAENKMLRLRDEAYNYIESLRKMKVDIRRNDDYILLLEIDIRDIVKIFFHNEDIKLKDLIYNRGHDNGSIIRICDLISGVRDFFDKCRKVVNVIKWLNSKFPDIISEELSSSMDEEFVMLNLEVNNYYSCKDDFDVLKAHVENEISIDKELENVIKDKGFDTDCNAGWLSRDGKYYALKGSISNYIHIKIAQNLLDNGVITIDDDNYKNNPDGYLSMNGWVKIHDDNILYDGYSITSINNKIIRLTNEQKDFIVKYGNFKYNGFLKFGIFKKSVSMRNFNMTEDLMIGKLFN